MAASSSHREEGSSFSDVALDVDERPRLVINTRASAQRSNEYGEEEEEADEMAQLARERARRKCARKCGKVASNCICCLPSCLCGCVKNIMVQVLLTLLVFGAVIGLIAFAIVRLNATAATIAEETMQSYLSRLTNFATTPASAAAAATTAFPYRCVLWSGGALPANAWAVTGSGPLLYGSVVLRGLLSLHVNVSVAGINWPQLRASALVAPALAGGGGSVLVVPLGNVSAPVPAPALGDTVTVAIAVGCEDRSDVCALVEANRVSARPVYFALFSHATLFDQPHALVQAPLTQCVQ